MKSGAMKDIINIAMRLTITCILAGIVMGLAFVLTHDAKERNEQARDERVMYAILGYDKHNPVPKTMAMHTVYRYIITRGDEPSGEQSVGYIVPLKHKGIFTLVEMDLSGSFMRTIPMEIDEAKLRNAGERDSAVRAAVNAGMHAPNEPSAQARYADNLIVVTNDGKRAAYILDNKYPGFKTFIHVKLALDAQYVMLGFEVLEHEEDPGLGAEIVQPWFKGQFEGKTFEQLKALDVVRTPMPDDYRDALNGKFDQAKTQEIRASHQDDPIYALTGATISSRSVLNGNKAMVKKFAYRMEALDKVLSEQNIETAFGSAH